jgi:hypothetical protein
METWRLIGRDVACGLDASVDGQDCYAFQRGQGRKTETHIIPVVKFWGRMVRSG